MEVTIKASPEELAMLVVELQSRYAGNALYDYEHGVKYTLPYDNSNGGGVG